MDEILITLPRQDDKLQVQLPDPEIEVFYELKEQYNFSTDAGAARCFLKLGMMSMVDNDPRHSPTTDADDEEPETIREMIPKGKENAVDMNDDFWEQILRDRMLDIVEEDPEIHRDGFNIYR